MTVPRVDRARVRQVVLETVAAEHSCAGADLLDGRVHIVPAGPAAPGERNFEPPRPYFSIATLGTGGVICASPELMGWVRPLYEGADRDEVVLPWRIAEATRQMERHGQSMFGPFPRWVCSEDDLREQPVPDGYETELRLADGPHPSSAPPEPDGRRPGERTPLRFRVVALRDGKPVGSAPVMEDSATLWQIGIAIAEEHRGRGLGRALTGRAAREILDRGAVPYYGTTAVNVWSMRTAISCGFYPAWVHMFARDVREEGA